MGSQSFYRLLFTLLYLVSCLYQLLVAFSASEDKMKHLAVFTFYKMCVESHSYTAELLTTNFLITETSLLQTAFVGPDRLLCA